VISQGRALGKPKNSTEAQDFLRELSGGVHSVITGIYILNMKSADAFQGYDETKVEFRKLTENEIADYVATSEPLD
jgi:septum formation protein